MRNALYHEVQDNRYQMLQMLPGALGNSNPAASARHYDGSAPAASVHTGVSSFAPKERFVQAEVSSRLSASCIACAMSLLRLGRKSIPSCMSSLFVNESSGTS